jgi:putative ABC transport system permease protein
VLMPQRLTATLLSLFGALTLALAAVGIYGVLAYAVSQRTREIGIRVALGARARDVVTLVLGRMAILIAAGVALGLALALAAARAVAAFLFGVDTDDPLAFLSATLLLAAVALVASFVPARRAASVDPMTALRAD